MRKPLLVRALGRSLVLLALLVSAAPSLQAQFELGIAGGVSRYEGDLAPQGPGALFMHNGASFGIYGRAPIGSHLAARVFAQSGKISGDDRDRNTSRIRNLSFESELRELGAVLEVHPIGQRFRVSPYVFGGGSVYRFDPVTVYRGETIRLQPLGTEGQGRSGFGDRYALTRFAWSVGSGIRIKLTEHLNLGVDVSTRLTRFDHLDDVSGLYVSPAVLNRDETGLAAALADRSGELDPNRGPNQPPGSARGDSDDDDWLYFGHVTLGWRFGKGALSGLGRESRFEKCYKF